MSHNNTVLQQLLSFVPRTKLEALTGQHKSDAGCRTMNTWQQFMLLLFAQANQCESLRDIEAVWQSQQSKWYHLGIESVSRSTLSDANNRRDPVIFEELFFEVLKRVRPTLSRKEYSFSNDLYHLDGSLVTLVYSLFDWAKYRKTKGAIRMHTLFCGTEQIPCWMNITDGKKHEIRVAKESWESWNLPKGSILCFDRGYVDYAWWDKLNAAGIFWITREKKNMHFFATKQFESDHPHVIKDEEVWCVQAEDKYPKAMRRIEWYNPLEDEIIVFITNNKILAPEQIAEAYKARWDIELFFKWIKQHLRIKSFFGTSQKAVMSQIWIALIYFLILSYIKAKAKLTQTLFILSKVFAQALFERIHLIELFYIRNKKGLSTLSDRASPQLALF